MPLLKAEEAIREIAETTGGRAFTAADLEELEEIYRVLDEVSPVELNTLSYRPRRALYHWPLGGSVIIGIAQLLGAGIASRIPRKKVNNA